jgi:hypothetical protein
VTRHNFTRRVDSAFFGLFFCLLFLFIPLLVAEDVTRQDFMRRVDSDVTRKVYLNS